MYLFMKDTHRERQRHRQREKQTSRREPDVGLDPGDSRITPLAEGGAKLLSHLGCPCLIVLLCYSPRSNTAASQGMYIIRALAHGSGFNLCTELLKGGAWLPPEGTEAGGHEKAKPQVLYLLSTPEKLQFYQFYRLDSM